jgi:hypothetical protein
MKNSILLALTLIALAGCASQRLSDGEKSIIIENFIASEKLETRSTISAFNMDSWTSLSDQYLILSTSPFRPYLLKLAMRCHNLNFSPTLIIDSAIPNSLTSGFDAIYTPDDQAFKCNISRIYPLSKEQNKALISAVNPVAKDKPIEKPATTEKDNEDNTPEPAAN